MDTRTVHGYVCAKRLDELCTGCWLPSLIHTTIVILLPTGVSEHDRGIRCVHCGPRPNQ